MKVYRNERDLEKDSHRGRRGAGAPGPQLRLCAAGAAGKDCQPERYLRLRWHVPRDERLEQGASG